MYHIKQGCKQECEWSRSNEVILKDDVVVCKYLNIFPVLVWGKEGELFVVFVVGIAGKSSCCLLKFGSVEGVGMRVMVVHRLS